MADAEVIPARITKENLRYTKKKVFYAYLAAIAFWFLIWAIIGYYLELSIYAWLIFVYGLFYFMFTIYVVDRIETVERKERELFKTNIVERYSQTIAALALGVAVFISIHRGTGAFNDLKKLIVLPIAGFVFIVLGPLTFFWDDDTSPRLYVERHYKAILYMIGIFLICTFMIEMIIKIHRTTLNVENLSKTIKTDGGE